jgi:phage terminase large subunit-like protein
LASLEVLNDIADYLDYKEVNRLEFFTPYGWQYDFYQAGSTHRFRMLMAANRVGKTYSQAVETAYHLTGLYPADWEGIRFDFPPSIWALGVSGEQIRDVIQKELFGDLIPKEGFTGTGAVPKKLIGSITPAIGTPRLAKEVKVKHVSGGFSDLGFRSYTQGQHVLMGTAKDYIWIDEEPEDDEIVPQCTIRLTTGNKGLGGYMVMTMTPENGATALVNQYTGEDIAESQYLLNVTWDDAPHLNEQAKKDILAGIPHWQHDMRSKGVPVLGEGMVYPIADEDIICDPFEIPEYFKLISAIDFGVTHPTAGAWVAYDSDADIIYLTGTYRKGGAGEEIIAQHASVFNGKGHNIPVIYPHDGDNERGTGPTYRDMYANEHKVNMHIKFSNEGEAESNYVAPGLTYIYDRMVSGRFKVFSTCKEFFDEKRRYHRKKGKIVKEHDDVMDAVRYSACTVTRFGVQGRKKKSYSRMSPKLGRF